MYSGGGSISAGYIEVTTMDMQNKPVSNAMVRIHKEENGTIVFETSVRTDINGRTGDIMLEAPSVLYSLDSSQQVLPYGVYNVEITKEGYDIEVRIGVQIFANSTSSLPVMMQYCYPREPQRNVICIDDHKLFSEQGESPCSRRS